MGGPPVFKGSSAAPARPLAQPSDVQGARPRVGRRRRNDGDQWVERGKRGASERGTPLCYSGSSSSFIRSAAISATFVTDPRSLRACVRFPDLSPIAEQQQQRGEGGEGGGRGGGEEEEEKEEEGGGVGAPEGRGGKGELAAGGFLLAAAFLPAAGAGAGGGRCAAALLTWSGKLRAGPGPRAACRTSEPPARYF